MSVDARYSGGAQMVLFLICAHGAMFRSRTLSCGLKLPLFQENSMLSVMIPFAEGMKNNDLMRTRLNDDLCCASLDGCW